MGYAATDKYSPEADVPAARDGDRDAQQRILHHMTGAVKDIAQRYATNFPFLNYDDLVQEGHMAVLRAIKRWRDDRGTKFSTYAFQAIKNRAWIVARRTRILLQLDDPWTADNPESVRSERGRRTLEELAIDPSDSRPKAAETFAGLGWDRCRVLIARLRPVIEGRGARPWAVVARMENLPVRRCQELYAEAIAMVKAAHGESE